MSRRTLHIMAAVVSAFILSSCVQLQAPVTLDRDNKEYTLAVKIHNYRFEPNNIVTHDGNTILFKLENVTISEHNFTLTDPDGAVIRDVNIPRDKTEEIKINFPRAGIYHFYCNEPLHSSLGMKGQIEVVRR